MSRKCYHWCQLSPTGWENCDHEKGDMWSIQLIKDNLEEQRINLDMIPSEKKDMYCLCYLIQFQYKTTFSSLLHAEIGIGNKISESFYRWISKYIEPLSNEEIEMINNLIDLQIEQIQNKKLLNQINHQNVLKNLHIELQRRN